MEEEFILLEARENLLTDMMVNGILFIFCFSLTRLRSFDNKHGIIQYLNTEFLRLWKIHLVKWFCFIYLFVINLGDIYVGQYRNNKKHGKGVYTFGKGQWEGDCYNGGFLSFHIS